MASPLRGLAQLLSARSLSQWAAAAAASAAPASAAASTAAAAAAATARRCFAAHAQHTCCPPVPGSMEFQAARHAVAADDKQAGPTAGAAAVAVAAMPSPSSPPAKLDEGTLQQLQAAPGGAKKTFYKRKLPCPPAIEFSSAEGELQGRALACAATCLPHALTSAVDLTPAFAHPTRHPTRQAARCSRRLLRPAP
jgi:hypothetical protein